MIKWIGHKVESFKKLFESDIQVEGEIICGTTALDGSINAAPCIEDQNGTSINIKAADGLGTDKTGGGINIKTGKSTGNAHSDDIDFYITQISGASSGSTLQNNLKVASIDGGLGLFRFYKQIYSQQTDGQEDLKIVSSADTGDYFSISTTTHGATTIQTVDDNATAAHLELAVDGNITLDSAEDIYLEVADDADILLKNVSNPYAKFTAEDGAATEFFLYERGGSTNADYMSISVEEHGETMLKTLDAGGTAAHFEIDADGDITLDSAGQIKLEPVAGNNILLDGTVTVDGGSVTGITTLGVDSVSLTAVQTASESFADNDTSIMTSAAINDRINRPTKQIQHVYANFKDNAGTTEHFIPLAGVPDEKTGFSNEQVLLLMPTGGHVKEIIVRANYAAYTSENIVLKVYTRALNKKVNNKTQIGEDITIAAPLQSTTSDDNTRSTGSLGTAHPYVKYDMLGISMTWQSTGPTNSNDRTYVTVVLENDLTTLAY